jgi:hypothetical protein
MKANAKKVARPLYPSRGDKIELVELVRQRTSPWHGVPGASPGVPFKWCFCKLCSQQTEFAVAVKAVRIFKRLNGSTAKSVPLTDKMLAEAFAVADETVALYERALKGEFGPDAPGRILLNLGAPIGTCLGDPNSVSRHSDHMENLRQHAFNAAKAALLWREAGGHGTAAKGAATLPMLAREQRPSKLYCSAHSPRRSEEARRAYQRDRAFTAEYEEEIRRIWSEQLVGSVWSESLGCEDLHSWDIEHHAKVRRLAYENLQEMKTPTKLIDLLQSRGIENQSEMARQLGISRQAVSAAIKRRKLMAQP